MQRILLAFGVLTIMLGGVLIASGQQRLRQRQAISLPDVVGRIDHLSADVQGRRLFVSALGNNTVEVLDLAAGRRIGQIPGLHEPQGVLFVPESNRIYVANGENGAVAIFDGTSYHLLATLQLGSDADNLRYDSATQQVWVGYGDGALAEVDGSTGRKLGDFPLVGHPESFRLEESGSRIFVNVPAAQQIAVVDRTRRGVIAVWPLEAQANFPMSLDEIHHRLLVVTRRPARLLVVDATSGKTLSSAPTVGDADDLFCDLARRRAYVSGGEGFIDVFEQQDQDHYHRLERIPTAAGARTSLFVPALNRLYLAVPNRSNQPAEIRVFEAAN